MAFPSAVVAPRLATSFLPTTVCYSTRQVARNVISLLRFSLDTRLPRVRKLTRTNHPSSSASTQCKKKNEVLDILGPMQDSRCSKYLGLPSIIGKSNNEVFVEIKEKVGRKLLGWKEKMLSMRGKEFS